MSRRRIALLAVVAAVIVALVIVVAFMAGRGSSVPQGEATVTPSASPSPSYDMTAQAVPNKAGSYGQFTADQVAELFTVALYSWKPGDPEGSSMLTALRPWTTDELFARLVDMDARPKGWTPQEQAAGSSQTVGILDTEVETHGAELTDARVRITFTVVRTDKAGKETRTRQSMTLVPAYQGVDVPVDGGGTKRINEVRIGAIESVQSEEEGQG